jgi:DNA ligase (NAD+)
MDGGNLMLDFDAGKLNEQQLEEIITYHNQRYWDDNAAVISDERYDELIRALQKINPQHRLLEQINTPAVAGTGKVTHAKPMLSLDKAYSIDEVINWAKKYIRTPDEMLLVQPKYDGISTNYADGVLATRGDGTEGEDISDKIPLLELETNKYTGKLDRPVRGEIVIRDDDFIKIYSHIEKKGGGRYKNSRNAVAGIMGLKDISDMVKQHAKLTLVDYELFSSRVPFIELAAEWPGIVAGIESLPYPTDGIVIKFADHDYSESLGNTAHHPRGQIAFKFSGIRRESKLVDVQWSFGKNCLTPVAVIEPVEIGGITIRHASLHNVQNIIDRDIHTGDTVTVERAGDVIPYIVHAAPGIERHSAIITNCPSCNHELSRRGPELCCLNPECFETRLQRLAAAVKNIGIERLGEPNIRKMMQQLNVRSLKDIFSLQLSDILKLDGFKEKSANNLYSEINNARTVNDYQLLAALNIPNIGANVAKSILTSYSLNELRTISVEVLSTINGIGPERAGALQRELEAQSAILDELLECVEIKHTKESDSGNLPKICFTGKMPEPRDYYEKIAREKGYAPVDSVTRDLSILVAEDPAAKGGKLDKARKLNIKIVNLEEWNAMGDPIPPPPPDSVTVITPSANPPVTVEKEQPSFGF